MPYYIVTLTAKVEADNLKDAEKRIDEDFKQGERPSYVKINSIESY